jgi:hypothetical protein
MHVLASARLRGRPWSAPRAWRGDRELTLGQPRHGGQDAASPGAGTKSVRTAEAARAPKRYARGLGGHFAGASQARLWEAPLMRDVIAPGNAGLSVVLSLTNNVILGRDRSGRRDDKRARMGEAHHASGDALG